MSNLSVAAKLKRPPFAKRTIRLVGTTQVDTAIAMLRNCPLDADKPLLLTLDEEPKARTLDQNARMWAGPLKDISKQGWIEGRQYSEETWHEHFKREFLPDDTVLSADELMEQVKDPTRYRKWGVSPWGERICTGSTTDLTKRGMAIYMQQIEAFGAGLGVQFHEFNRE